MRLIALIAFVVAVVHFTEVSGQLAAVFSPTAKSSKCGTWSQWGTCLWTKPLDRSIARRARAKGSNLYLEQISKQCHRHWFFSFMRDNYRTALNNFFAYLGKITINRKPCGQCSYKQSCGAGGSDKCEKAPWDANRPFLPFHVSEALCCDKDIGGSQADSCDIRYNIVATNNASNPCQVWPSKIPKLTGIEGAVKEVLYNIPWSNCVPDTRPNRRNKRTGLPQFCRCCCFPYAPNPKTYKCERIAGENVPLTDGKCEAP